MKKFNYSSGIVKTENESAKNLGGISDGVCTKFWVRIDSQTYLFKENYIRDTYTNIGEVLYSFFCEKFGFSCVNSFFAENNENNSKNCGCLIENMLNQNESLVVLQHMMSRYGFDINYNSYKLCTIKEVESLLDLMDNLYIFDREKIVEELWDMFLIDYFFRQADRHIENIGFIVSPTDKEKIYNLKLAPMFDNGMCFAFTSLPNEINTVYEDYLASKDKLEWMNENLSIMLKFSPEPINSEREYLPLIYVQMQKDPKFKQKVYMFLNLDFEDSLNEFEEKTNYKIDSKYRFFTSLIFNYKKKMLKDYLFEKIDSEKQPYNENNMEM